MEEKNTWTLLKEFASTRIPGKTSGLADLININRSSFYKWESENKELTRMDALNYYDKLEKYLSDKDRDILKEILSLNIGNTTTTTTNTQTDSPHATINSSTQTDIGLQLENAALKAENATLKNQIETMNALIERLARKDE